MHQQDLISHYEYLRYELERAYAAPVWDSQLIDNIANEITQLEWAFALHSPIDAAPFDSQSPELCQ